MDLSSTIVLDGFAGPTAVLDPGGRIVAVNRTWRDFGDANGLASRDHGLNMDYLAVCDAARGRGSEGAASVAAGLRRLLRGEQDSFDYEYPCAAPGRPRWFKLLAGVLRDAQGLRGVLVSHVDLTAFEAHALAELSPPDRRILDALAGGRSLAELTRREGFHTQLGMEGRVRMLLERLRVTNRQQAAELGHSLMGFLNEGSRR